MEQTTNGGDGQLSHNTDETKNIAAKTLRCYRSPYEPTLTLVDPRALVCDCGSWKMSHRSRSQPEVDAADAFCEPITLELLQKYRAITQQW